MTITLNYFVGTVNFGRPLARKDPQKKPCQKRRALRSGGSEPELLFRTRKTVEKERSEHVG